MGHLSKNKEPTFHDFYPKADIQLDLNRKEPGKIFYPIYFPLTFF